MKAKAKANSSTFVLLVFLLPIIEANKNTNNIGGYRSNCDILSTTNQCNHTLRCSGEGICSCPTASAIWNSTEPIGCNPGDSHCIQIVLGGTFYDSETSTCRCFLSDASHPGGRRPCDSSNYPCPLNSYQFHDRDVGVTSCQCPEGYFTIKDLQECVKGKEYGEECDNAKVDFPCSKTTFSSCINGSCSCSEIDNEIFEPSDKSCRIKLNGICDTIIFTSPSNKCIRNAECVGGKYTDRFNGRCKCKLGYSNSDRSDAGKCKGVHGSKCTYKDDCINSFDCIDGLCGCGKGPVSEIYNSELRECVGLVGSTCNPGSKQIKRSLCVPTASCNSTTRLCSCEQGYGSILGNNWKCYKLLQHGQSCLEALDCDFRKGYACINGKCSCVDVGLKYVDEEVSCVASLGYKCGNYGSIIKECLTSSSITFTTNPRRRCEYYSVSCEANTTCRQVELFSTGRENVTICQRK